MTYKNYSRNVQFMGLFRCCFMANALIFGGLFEYLSELGFTLFDIAVLQLLFSISLIGGEVLSSRLADHHSRTMVLQLGSGILIISSVLYGTAQGALGVCVAEVIMGLGFAMISGVDEALFVESLNRLGRSDESQKKWGTIKAYEGIASVIFFLLGGIIAHYFGVRATYVASTGIFTIQLLVSFFLLDSRESSGQSAKSLTEIKSVVLTTWRIPRLRNLIVTLGIISGLVGLPVWMYFGLITGAGGNLIVIGAAFALMNLTCGLAAKYASQKGERPYAALLIFGLCSFCLAVVEHPLALLAILGHQISRGVLSVAFFKEFHSLIDDENRATVVSIKGVAQRLSYAALLLPVYAIASSGGIRMGLGVIAALSITVVGVKLLWGKIDIFSRLRG